MANLFFGKRPKAEASEVKIKRSVSDAERAKQIKHSISQDTLEVPDDDEDAVPTTKSSASVTSYKTPAPNEYLKHIDPKLKKIRENNNLDNGKIHIETLFSIFRHFQLQMNTIAYGAGGDPFLLERRVSEKRQQLQRELENMGFGDILDFTPIPMPDPYKVGHRTVKEIVDEREGTNPKNNSIHSKSTDKGMKRLKPKG